MKLETILEIYKTIIQEKGEFIQFDLSPRDPICYHLILSGLDAEYWIDPEKEDLKISYFGTCIYETNMESNPIADQIKAITLQQCLPYDVLQMYKSDLSL